METDRIDARYLCRQSCGWSEHYSVSKWQALAPKAGVIGMTKAVGKECSKHDIAISAVSPATAKTCILDELKPKFIGYMPGRNPRGRFPVLER